MRVGMFTEIYHPYIGGVTVAIDAHKKALEQKGHKVFIITVNNETKCRRIKKEGDIIKIPGMPSGIYDYNIKLTYPIMAIDKIKKLKLDLIHTHTEFGIGRFGKSMAKRLDIPHVHTFHTMYEKSLDYVTKGKFPKIAKKTVYLIIRLFLDNNVNKIIVPGLKTQKNLKSKYRVKREITVLPTGIDLDVFKDQRYKKMEAKKIRQKLKIEEDDFLITYIGRLGYEKRIHLLIEYHAKLVKKHKNAKMLIVGGGPEEEKLKLLVKKHKLESNIIFTSKISHEDISKYYKVASVLASASDMETQGLTVMEAFASGKPVVCFKDDAFLESVSHGVDGYLFRNKNEYIKIMNDLISNPEMLDSLEQKAKEKSLSYSLDNFGDKLLDVYYKALENKYHWE